jgi:hypothetical protein
MMRAQVELTPVSADIYGVKCRIWRGLTDTGAEIFLVVAAVSLQELPHLDQGGNRRPRAALAKEGYRAELVNGNLILRRKEQAQ